jgi:hypothetical protein
MVPRLACWPDCVQQGSTAELRDRLSLLHRIDWQELRQVRDYLSEQQAHDGQVTCFSATTLPLYLELGIRPSTRHLLLQGTYSVFASKRGRLQQELDAGAQRYVACDLSLRNGDRHSVLAAVGDRGLKPEAAPRNFRELFPRPMTLVFRAGDYAVFALDEPRQTAQP